MKNEIKKPDKSTQVEESECICVNGENLAKNALKVFSENPNIVGLTQEEYKTVKSGLEYCGADQTICIFKKSETPLVSDSIVSGKTITIISDKIDYEETFKTPGSPSGKTQDLFNG